LRDDEVAALCRSVSLWPRLNTWYAMPRRCPPGTRVALLAEVDELKSISRAERIGEEDQPPLQFPHLQLAWAPSNSAATRDLAARARLVMSRTDRTPEEVEALAVELVRQQSDDLLPWAYRILEREPRLSSEAEQALREYVFCSFGHSPRHRARLIRHVSAYGNKHYRFMFDQWKAAGLPFTIEEVDRLYCSFDHWVKTLTIRNWRTQCRQDAVQFWERILENDWENLEILR
jgi:predicted TIM-barrel fold metal-dependent hydrolase